MYFEEKVIDGVLCMRNTPNGQFIKLSQERLTKMLSDERKHYAKLSEEHSEMMVELYRLKKATGE